MKEYSLFIQNGNAIPYILKTSNSINDIKLALYNIVSLEEERRRPYFVDNDFFQNKHSLVSNSKYLCIRVRDVSEWNKYSEEEEKEIKNNYSNNIRYFSNYLK